MEVAYNNQKNDAITYKLEHVLLQEIARVNRQKYSLLTSTDADLFTATIVLLTMQCKGLVNKTEVGYILTNKGRERLQKMIYEKVQ